jgi:hypothetical protein
MTSRSSSLGVSSRSSFRRDSLLMCAPVVA